MVFVTGYTKDKKQWEPKEEFKSNPRLASVLIKNALFEVGTSLDEEKNGFKLVAGDKAITFIFIKYDEGLVHR